MSISFRFSSPLLGGALLLVLGCSKSGSSVPDDCWSLPIVHSVRVMPVPGREEAVQGARIMGSNAGPTVDFEELASVGEEPEPGEWLELRLDTPRPFRYVKYHAPAGSYGAVAEVMLLGEDGERLDGAPFGTAPAPSSPTTLEDAFDEDVDSYYEGGTESGNYVGLDLAAGHVTLAPTIAPAGGAHPLGQAIRIEAENGARVLYSWDGADPREQGSEYAGELSLPEGSSALRVVAQAQCKHPSDVRSVAYQATSAASASDSAGTSSTVSASDSAGTSEEGTIDVAVRSGEPQSVRSMHIGNSLTDTLVELFPTLVQSHGDQLDFRRYTVPGAGLWLYERAPTGGFGVDDVRATLRSERFDHLVMQPYPNMPCQPKASSDGDDSDASFTLQAWNDAAEQNPNIQVWIYQQWPVPLNYANCITGGDWTRGDWAPPAPQSFADAVANELRYDEEIVAELVRLHPEGPTPRIIPVGLALVALQEAIEAGRVPGITDFFTQIFELPADDDHVTAMGAYFVSEVFYSSMFQREPGPTPSSAQAGLSDEQAAVMRRIAWQSVQEYAFKLAE